MPYIEIEAPASPSSWGALVKVDGRELTEVREVSVRLAVDSVVEAHVEMFATKSFHLESDADLHITVMPVPGYSLIAEELPDGRIKYTSESNK